MGSQFSVLKFFEHNFFWAVDPFGTKYKIMTTITFPLSVEFCGHTFLQQPGTVIPAVPNSPHFAAQETFIQHLRTLNYHSLLDIGSGSGMLGISLWRPGVDLVMTDINPHAVALAKQNSEILAVPSTCLQGSWFEPVKGQYDLIIANPPHGTHSEWHQYTWAHTWVPKVSVYGGIDGLDSIRDILRSAAAYTQGYLCLIYTEQQHSQVLELAIAHGFRCDHHVQHQSTVMGCYQVNRNPTLI